MGGVHRMTNRITLYIKSLGMSLDVEAGNVPSTCLADACHTGATAA